MIFTPSWMQTMLPLLPQSHALQIRVKKISSLVVETKQTSDSGTGNLLHPNSLRY